MIRATALAALLLLGRLAPSEGPQARVEGGSDRDFAREGDGERRKALDALEGKPASEIEVESWVAGEATTLRKLAGKVVLLDFWGTW